MKSARVREAHRRQSVRQKHLEQGPARSIRTHRQRDGLHHTRKKRERQARRRWGIAVATRVRHLSDRFRRTVKDDMRFAQERNLRPASCLILKFKDVAKSSSANKSLTGLARRRLAQGHPPKPCNRRRSARRHCLGNATSIRRGRAVRRLFKQSGVAAS